MFLKTAMLKIGEVTQVGGYRTVNHSTPNITVPNTVRSETKSSVWP